MGALFTKVICTFLKSVQKDGYFDAPFDLFQGKKFSSLRRDNELFMRTEKAKNGRNRSKFALPKFYVTHRNYEIFSKSLVPTGGQAGALPRCHAVQSQSRQRRHHR